MLQYFVFGLERDYLGGIFGSEKGVNGYTIIFFIIIISKSLILYMSKKESALMCFSPHRPHRDGKPARNRCRKA